MHVKRQWPGVGIEDRLSCTRECWLGWQGWLVWRRWMGWSVFLWHSFGVLVFSFGFNIVFRMFSFAFLLISFYSLLVFLWLSFAFPLDFPLVSLWRSFGFPDLLLLLFSWLPLCLPVVHYCLPMVVFFASLCFFLAFSFGFPLIFRVLSSVFPIGFLWACLLFP